MTRKLRFEDIPDCPFTNVFVIDDKGAEGEDIISSAVITNDEAEKLKAKSDTDLKKDMDKDDPPVEKKSMGKPKKVRG